MRKLDNWLRSLLEFVEETEAPRDFWFWGGVFTIASALRRRVWLPYGIGTLYPNLYVLIVASPGKRKGGPPSLAARMLGDIDIPLAADSSSKRALTKELAEVSKQQPFYWNGRPHPMAALNIISKEMSSMLALDPKGLIECLTDLYDSHDVWKYKTSEKGHDFLYNVCINCLVATTPTWLSANLPQEAIGGGYTSRHVIVTGEEKYKDVPIPPEMDPTLYKKLKEDLLHISNLAGPFTWGEGSEAFFDRWYRSDRVRLTQELSDDRVAGFLERIHIMILKTAMILRISYSDDLSLEVPDLQTAVGLLESAAKGVTEALGGHGRSQLGPDTKKVMNQIQSLGRTTPKELLRLNVFNITKSQLIEILDALKVMEYIKWYADEKGKEIIEWKGK